MNPVIFIIGVGGYKGVEHGDRQGHQVFISSHVLTADMLGLTEDLEASRTRRGGNGLIKFACVGGWPPLRALS